MKVSARLSGPHNLPVMALCLFAAQLARLVGLQAHVQPQQAHACACCALLCMIQELHRIYIQSIIISTSIDNCINITTLLCPACSGHCVVKQDGKQVLNHTCKQQLASDTSLRGKSALAQLCLFFIWPQVLLQAASFRTFDGCSAVNAACHC